MKTISSCCGCVFVCVLLFLVACMVLVFIIGAKTASAQELAACTSALPAARMQGYEITPGFVTPLAANIARGTFFTSSLTLTLRPNDCVTVAGSEDGSRPWWVDDAVRLLLTHSDGSISTWEWDFRSPSRLEVVPLPPLELTSLFDVGENRMDLAFVDRQAPFDGASPVWLIVYSMPAPSLSTAMMTSAPMPVPKGIAAPTRTSEPPFTAVMKTPTVALNAATRTPPTPMGAALSPIALVTPAAAAPSGITTEPARPYARPDSTAAPVTPLAKEPAEQSSPHQSLPLWALGLTAGGLAILSLVGMRHFVRQSAWRQLAPAFNPKMHGLLRVSAPGLRSRGYIALSGHPEGCSGSGQGARIVVISGLKEHSLFQVRPGPNGPWLVGPDGTAVILPDHPVGTLGELRYRWKNTFGWNQVMQHLLYRSAA